MKSKVVAILQSNYIPWKGYFDLINRCDEFVLLDDVQYTRRDWRNRNKIKTETGLKWLTIPVDVKGKYEQKINETKVNDLQWADKHWNTLKNTYRKTEGYEEMSSTISYWYEGAGSFQYLSEINRHFIAKICDELGINTIISSSTDYDADDNKNDRLISICNQANATTYLSGPAAKSYLDEDMFEQAGLEVQWMDYSNYVNYKQPHSEFEAGVTILDVLFNTGKDAPSYTFQSI